MRNPVCGFKDTYLYKKVFFILLLKFQTSNWKLQYMHTGCVSADQLAKDQRATRHF